MKKKLLVTASTFPRWENDTEPRFILDLCKALTKEFDVTVLAPACPNAKTHEELEGVNVIRYHYFPIHQWETLCYPGAIVPRIKEKKIRIFLVPFLFIGLWIKMHKIIDDYDVVHAHWLIPQGIVQSFFKKPYIVTGHGGDVHSLNAGIIKALKIRTLKRAKAVTVVSHALEEKIHLIAPDVPVSIRSMGCDVKTFSPRWRKDNFFQQNDKKVVLFVGRLAEIKGVTYLIEAMKQVDAKLVIVGKGDCEDVLKQQAKDQKEKVLFLGPKTHQELKEIYASADVLVIPSITDAGGAQEGLPTVVIEAMASGLPVIGTNTGGIPEIVKNGINGLVIEEKNAQAITQAINTAFADEKTYGKYRENALLTVNEYDYDLIAKTYAEFLN